ncbi:MAG: hypothetical protein WC876_09245 [Candidatus Thermoplasmatota archaeon]|jgi:hypothetical protein
MKERTLQGALTFLGFAVSVIAVFYFAIEYIPRVSEWTQVAALILLGFCFAFLGVYLRGTSVGQPFFSGPRLQWLRPPVVLYLLAIFSGIVAEVRFLGIDGVPKPVKILASLVLGIGLIVVVAMRSRRPSTPAIGARPEPAALKAADAGPRKTPASRTRHATPTRVPAKSAASSAKSTKTTKR